VRLAALPGTLCQKSPGQNAKSQPGHGGSSFAFGVLRQLAIRNHRSMQEQVRLLIEREVRYSQVGAVERARQWRTVLAGRNFSDLAANIQADRNR
jgi:hypothetical protein